MEEVRLRSFVFSVINFSLPFQFLRIWNFFLIARGCVLGGPAVGDIRSRCLRLADKSSSEAVAVRRLLGHRLPLDSRQAKSEW